MDDPLDAFAVHGACGYWGVLSCSLFSTPQFTFAISGGRIEEGGAFYGGAQLLAGASVFILAHTAWVGLLSVCIFMLLKRLAILRVPRHVEIASMNACAGKGEDNDASTHGGVPFWPDCTAPAPSSNGHASGPSGGVEFPAGNTGAKP